jgi:hypothetical protein
MDGVGGGSTAGSGALLGLNAENEPLPVEGTETTAGTRSSPEEGAARLLSWSNLRWLSCAAGFLAANCEGTWAGKKKKACYDLAYVPRNQLSNSQLDLSSKKSHLDYQKDC